MGKEISFVFIVRSDEDIVLFKLRLKDLAWNLYYYLRKCLFVNEQKGIFCILFRKYGKTNEKERRASIVKSYIFWIISVISVLCIVFEWMSYSSYMSYVRNQTALKMKAKENQIVSQVESTEIPVMHYEKTSVREDDGGKYVLLVEDFELVIWSETEQKVIEKTGIDVRSLPVEEQEKLTGGISVDSLEELYGILEGYSS